MNTPSLLALLILLNISSLHSQEDRLIGIIDNTIVTVNPFDPELKNITKINLPPNTDIKRSICYHPLNCIFYVIHEGSTNPQLATFDFNGNYTILGEINYTNGNISIAEGIAYHENSNQIYISGSLDGFDFGSETIFTLDLNTLTCSYVTSIRTQENLFDVDNIVFYEDELFFNDINPGPAITKFYHFDISSASTTTELNEILSVNSDNTSDMVIIDEILYYKLPTNMLIRFDINNPIPIEIGLTHTTLEYNGEKLRGLEYIKGYRDFDYDRNLGDNFSICSGDVTDLIFTAEGYDILWSTGEISDTIQISEPGIYSVDVLLDGCKIFTSNSVIVDNDQSIAIDENINICQGDTIIYNGNEIFSEGQYQIEISSFYDCDTMVNLTVSVTDALTILQEYTICSGDVLMIDTIEINSAGLYTYVAESISSCDTLYLIDVAEINESTESIEIQLCNSDTAVINDIPYSLSGSYTQDFITSLGCDSTLIIEINNDIQIPTLIEAFTCEGLGITINGEEYQIPGSYEQILSTVTGCDSILNIIVTQNEIYVPNVFSPKISGNDSFGAFIPCEIDIFELHIYDRWGNLVFQAFDRNHFWDGTYTNEEGLTQGVYTYFLRYGNLNSTSMKSGNVLMLL